MAVTASWVVLVGFAVVWEVLCHRPGARWTSLSAIGSRLWSSRVGRFLLVTVWGFVGWHVFARYTLPR
jgi:Family of unknown function (DUF6186)